MHRKTYDLVYISMLSVLLAICSWISIPTMIPFTLQTFGIFFALLLLGGKLGTAAIAIYLLLGSIGLPVFSHFGAGIGYLFGNTGGYTFGFLFIGLIFWLSEILLPNNEMTKLLALVFGLASCYLFGTLWFMHLSVASGNILSFQTVFGMCILPFIFPDLCKLWAAYVLCKRIQKISPKIF